MAWFGNVIGLGRRHSICRQPAVQMFLHRFPELPGKSTLCLENGSSMATTVPRSRLQSSKKAPTSATQDRSFPSWIRSGFFRGGMGRAKRSSSSFDGCRVDGLLLGGSTKQSTRRSRRKYACGSQCDTSDKYSPYGLCLGYQSD